MSEPDTSKVIENVLAANRKYTNKSLALQNNLGMFAKEEDYTLLRKVLQQYIQEAAKLQTNLQEALTKVVELEAYQARREQYSERWWQQKRQALYEAFKEDLQKGLSQWLQIYAEALIAWELATCKKMVNELFPFPEQAATILPLFRKGIQAIEDETYRQALNMLVYLTQTAAESQPLSMLDEISRATLLIFMGRIYLYIALESEKARTLFEQAGELASNFGLPYAALGSYYQRQNDSTQPLSLYQRAIELSPRSPDGYIGMGLLAEERASWDEADDWYEGAIEAVQEEKDMQVALSKLLAPTSGNLYFQLAQTLRKQDIERALQAVEYAITIGIKGDGDYPARFAYKLKGEILEAAERVLDAAEAYFEAGQQFYLQDEYTIAIEILTHAHELNPKHISICWYLSDALRLSSYQTTPPYVNEDAIKKSLAIWEQAYKMELPGGEYAWVYITRALANEQLYHLPEFTRNQWMLWWEAITYVERAIFHAVDASTWAYMARYYRYLQEEVSAQKAALKALDLEPENITALEEQAAIMADVGEVEVAAQAIDRLQTLETLTWLDALKAYNLLYKGLLEKKKDSYEEAITLLDHALSSTPPSLPASPETIWYHDLRSDCYLMLNDIAHAREDLEWTWEQYKYSPTIESLNSFGWAAYNLARISEHRDSSFNDYIHNAIKIFSELCEDPVFAGYAHRNLGLSYLVRSEQVDDLVLGEKSLNTGIALTTTKRELDEVQYVDLYNIEKISAGHPHEAQVHEILTRLIEKITLRRTQLEKGRSVEEELKEVIASYSREDGVPDWPWLGAHASLARLYTEEKRWEEATATYLLLQKESERFPEANLGLEKILNEQQAEGNDFVKEDKPANQ